MCYAYALNVTAKTMGSWLPVPSLRGLLDGRKQYKQKIVKNKIKMYVCDTVCLIYFPKRSSEIRSDVELLLYVVVFFTLTDRASTIPTNIRGCQSGTWSQRGTKVNRPHHGDNPLLRPTGIQIATKSFATLQAMAPANNKTVHQTSFTPYREQPRSTRIVVAYPRPAFSATNRANTFQPVLINNSKFLKATHRTKIRTIEISRSMVVEALSW